jgi:hypothetical protein
MEKSENVIIGLHIPKTAGTSLRYAIEKIFNKEELIYLYRMEPGIKLSELIEYLKSKKNKNKPFPQIVYGHMGYGLHNILGINATYITILREPIKRAISMYRHEQRMSNALFHKEANLYTVAEFYSREFSPYFKNSMTRLLSGNLWQEENWYLEGDESDALNVAKRNLIRDFSYVGFTENLKYEEKKLSSYFGKKIKLIKSNSDPSPISINDLNSNELSVIKSKFELDIELYEFAKVKFLKHISRFDRYMIKSATKLKKIYHKSLKLL